MAPARTGSNQAHTADQVADLNSMWVPSFDTVILGLLVYTYVNVLYVVKDFVSFDLIAMMWHDLATHITER